MRAKTAQKSTPDGQRVWLEPQISVALSSRDFFTGRDPVLEAVPVDRP